MGQGWGKAWVTSHHQTTSPDHSFLTRKCYTTRGHRPRSSLTACTVMNSGTHNIKSPPHLTEPHLQTPHQNTRQGRHTARHGRHTARSEHQITTPYHHIRQSENQIRSPYHHITMPRHQAPRHRKDPCTQARTHARLHARAAQHCGVLQNHQTTRPPEQTMRSNH